MKSHLQVSPNPDLREGSEIGALCGTKVVRAQFTDVWDRSKSDVHQPINTLLLCTKCFLKGGEGRYVYAMVPGSPEGAAEEKE